MPHLTRRELAALLVGAAASPAAPGQDDKGDKKKPSPLDATADALLAVVTARHGRHLSEAQLKQVRDGIAGGLRSAAGLRRVALPADDEPAFVFQADLP